MSQALYRKWRPQKWDQVIGQEHIVQTLRNAVAAGRVGHAYLFPGPRGTGKTTTARLLAKAVNCLDPNPANRPCDECAHCLAVNQGRFLDLIEIDAASNTSVDDVRDLRDKINFAPNQGQYKVYIIDEVHMLSTAAFNALLKTLEEPPPHAIFILATTESHKIPATVTSRCQRHEFRRITSKEMVSRLQTIVTAENFQVDEDALLLIARHSTGSMRDAISLLDQLASLGERVTLALAQDVLGTATSQTVLDVVSALAEHQPAQALDHLHTALDSGADPRQLARQVVDYLRQVLLLKFGSGDQVDLPREAREQLGQHAQALDVPAVLHIIRVFNQAANDVRSAWQPGLPLELAVVEAVEQPRPTPTEAAPVHPLPAAPRPAAPSEPARKATPPPAQPAAPPPAGGLSLQTIQDQWKNIAAETRKYNKMTQPLLNSCGLLELRGNDLYLGFASELIKERMESSEHITVAEKALTAILGTRLRIHCVIAAGIQGGLPPDVASDGMVAAALSLGGALAETPKSKPRKQK